MGRVWILECAGFNGLSIAPARFDPTGQFLQEGDVDAHAGLGDCVFTDVRADAMWFESVEEALAYTMRQPDARPRRRDSKPNRPLRAFDWSPVPIDVDDDGKVIG